MSILLTAREISEKALRKAGVLSINDDAAEGPELAETLGWLDLIVAELAGTERCFFFIPDTLSIPLSADTPSYDLDGTLGADGPADGIQFPIFATIATIDNNGSETPIEIVRRRQYEELAKKATTGTPDRIFIDRLNDPKMFVYPVPGTGASGLAIKLVVQTFAPQYRLSQSGNKATGLRAAWQLWAITKLAAEIGDGPVRRLPKSEVDSFRRDAEVSLNRLTAFENREHNSMPHVTAFRDY